MLSELGLCLRGLMIAEDSERQSVLADNVALRIFDVAKQHSYPLGPLTIDVTNSALALRV
jgi:hypothetical protein